MTLDDKVREIAREEIAKIRNDVRKHFDGFDEQQKRHGARLDNLESATATIKTKHGWVLKPAPTVTDADAAANAIDKLVMYYRSDFFTPKYPVYEDRQKRLAEIIRKHANPAPPVVVTGDQMCEAYRDTLSGPDFMDRFAKRLTTILNAKVKP